MVVQSAQNVGVQKEKKMTHSYNETSLKEYKLQVSVFFFLLSVIVRNSVQLRQIQHILKVTKYAIKKGFMPFFKAKLRTHPITLMQYLSSNLFLL